MRSSSRDNGNTLTPETIGHTSGDNIPVELSTRFLEHFSEQLYSSPQKAFEELISNGWDAGASRVDVRISPTLNDPQATMCVLDNGVSMDVQGLHQLWRIAFSPKESQPVQNGRSMIGQFGIGKLATYVLANKLTYICKAADGVIRRVTMDYGEIDRQRQASDQLISEIKLPLYEVGETEIEEALKSVYDGAAILELIKAGVPSVQEALGEDEFGGEKAQIEHPTSGTWTLVVLSDLKPRGRDLKIGVLRRMLAAALPFGTEMAISINGQLVVSPKVDFELMHEWVIGPELEIDSIELDAEEVEPSQAVSEASSDSETTDAKPNPTQILQVTSGTSPKPYVELPEIGRLTGQVKLFFNKISGGKSDERGASNGFHVNVLGRVVNRDDPSFGEKNLSHAAWARFRMTVRADGLKPFLTINREQFQEGRELKIFRSFLRKVFNKARTYYDSDKNAELPDGGDVLVKSLGVLSLAPLRNVVSEALATESPLSDLFDESGITDREAKRTSWRENTAENISNALSQVKYERLTDDSFVKFRISDNTILINKDHPFVAEHSRTKAEKELMRTIAMVDLLADVYALNVGIDAGLLDNVRHYRDRLMRYRALQRRQSGTYIAKLLLEMQHHSNYKLLEAVLSDALRYLGFEVLDLGQQGEPEGIASAFSTPTFSSPTAEKPHPPLYSFSFDAKTSKHATAKTGNISLDAVVEHRNRYKADFALVVAPGFEAGAITTRCAELNVTPMAARDLGRLLEYTVEYGAIPLTKLKELFERHDPNEVSDWVNGLEDSLRSQRPLTIDTFLKALDNLKGRVPDVLPAGVIAIECRERLNAVTVKDDDVIAVARGLSILVPDLVGISEDKIVVNASAAHVGAAVSAQLEKLHSEHPIDVTDQKE